MRILLAEDERPLARALVKIFEKNFFTVDAVENGEDALAYLESGQYDVAVLDIMMPKADGITVLRRLRAAGNAIPVLLLTAKSEVDDKVQGLDSGANYYLTKPFDTKELVARVKAVLRRAPAESAPASGDADDTLRYPGLTVSLARYEVTYEGHELEMPPKELEVLFYLASHPNMVFTREQLLERVWGFDFFGDSRTVDVHIKRLREKLPGCEKYGWEIHTVWRVGYKFEYKAN